MGVPPVGILYEFSMVPGKGVGAVPGNGVWAGKGVCIGVCNGVYK